MPTPSLKQLQFRTICNPIFVKAFLTLVISECCKCSDKIKCMIIISRHSVEKMQGQFLNLHATCILLVHYSRSSPQRKSGHDGFSLSALYYRYFLNTHLKNKLTMQFDTSNSITFDINAAIFTENHFSSSYIHVHPHSSPWQHL